MSSVRAALITPLSGPLARYGEATALALTLWAERFTGADSVHLAVFDTHKGTTHAVRQAEGERPDLLFGPYGSGSVGAVAEKTKRLVWNHSGAGTQARGNVVSVLAPAQSYFVGAVDAVRRADPSVRRIGVLHRDSGFGRAIAEGAVETAARCGLRAQRAVLPAEPPEADLLLVAGRFDDDVRIARRYLPGPWRAVGLVAAGVEEARAAVGERCAGLLGPAQWLPSAAPLPDEGPTAQEFVAAYRARAGSDPPYPAAQACAAGIVALRCLHMAGASDDAAVLAAARHLDCTTLFGRFRIDPMTGVQVGHRMVTVQWQRGSRVVVWPPEQADAPVRLR